MNKKNTLYNMLQMTITMLMSTSIMAAENFLERKESYNNHRKENLYLHIRNAKAHGAIDPSVETLPFNIVNKLSKSGEFDSKNKEAIYLLMQSVTNGQFSSNFSVKELGGGFVSGKIYKVTNEDTKSAYFIKYLRQRTLLVPKGRILGEQVNLEAIRQNPLLEQYNWNGSTRDLSSLKNSSFHGSGERFLSGYEANNDDHLKIVLPKKIYEYHFKNQQKIFMVLPSAKGISLGSIIENNWSSSPEIVNNAFRKVGAAMAQLHTTHRKFKGTVELNEKNKDYFSCLGIFSHGDFHAHNIFVHDDRVSLIDAETTANSFDHNGLPNGPIYYDFFYLLLMTERHFPGVMESMNWQPFKELFKAYIHHYPTDEQDGLGSYLWHHLNNIKKFSFKDLFEHFKWTKTYSKSAVRGAKSIADYLVQYEYERIHLEAKKNSVNQVVPEQSIDHVPVQEPKEERPDEPQHMPKDMKNVQKKGKVFDLIQKHNQYIESAKPNKVSIPGKRVVRIVAQ